MMLFLLSFDDYEILRGFFKFVTDSTSYLFPFSLLSFSLCPHSLISFLSLNSLADQHAFSLVVQMLKLHAMQLLVVLQSQLLVELLQNQRSLPTSMKAMIILTRNLLPPYLLIRFFSSPSILVKFLSLSLFVKYFLSETERYLTNRAFNSLSDSFSIPTPSLFSQAFFPLFSKSCINIPSSLSIPIPIPMSQNYEIDP